MTHASFAELTTFGVGGYPSTLIAPATTDELVAAMGEVWGSGEEWVVVGGGSNLLVADAGFDGVAVLVRTRGITVIEDTAESVVLRVEAGEPWDVFVASTVERGLSGVEALSGIPGTVGAAPVQNIGAYGVDVAEVLVAVDFLDADTGARSCVPAADLALGYRTSALKRGRRGVVLAVEVRLKRTASGGVPVRYGQLASSLGVESGALVPATELRAAVLALRASKGMVLDPEDADTRGAGSFFTNPIVSAVFAAELPVDVPRWPVEPERVDVAVPLERGVGVVESPFGTPSAVKLSAAWLIEHAGVPRGFALPGSHASVSTKHTLALTNRGGASAVEVTELARYVQTIVFARFGVQLVPEPRILGDFGG